MSGYRKTNPMWNFVAASAVACVSLGPGAAVAEAAYNLKNAKPWQQPLVCASYWDAIVENLGYFDDRLSSARENRDIFERLSGEATKAYEEAESFASYKTIVSERASEKIKRMFELAEDSSYVDDDAHYAFAYLNSTYCPALLDRLKS